LILARTKIVSTTCLQINLHWILSLTHERYGRVTSFSNIAAQLGVTTTSSSEAQLSDFRGLNNTSDSLISRKANATFVILCRNSDLEGTVKSIRQMEDRFNRHHQYPWVLLNEEPFPDEFKK
jgi:alpha 1,2-mannosyltransferase